MTDTGPAVNVLEVPDDVRRQIIEEAARPMVNIRRDDWTRMLRMLRMGKATFDTATTPIQVGNRSGREGEMQFRVVPSIPVTLAPQRQGDEAVRGQRVEAIVLSMEGIEVLSRNRSGQPPHNVWTRPIADVTHVEQAL